MLKFLHFLKVKDCRNTYIFIFTDSLETQAYSYSGEWRSDTD